MVFSFINKSQLEGALRLDAEYYQPEYLSLISKIKSQKLKLLKDITFITDGIHTSIDYDKDSRIKCFSAQSVNENYFNDVESYISEKQHRENLRTSLKEGDVLLSSVGTIGNTAVVNADLLPANADRHVAIIRLKDKAVSPFYLSAFLNSKYGKFQSIRESTGNVQLNLFIDKIKNFVIPILDIEQTERISEQIRQGLYELENSKSLYSQAEDLLLQSLGLSTEALAEVERRDLSYMVNLSDIKSDHRADAEFFQPKYETIFEKINKPIKNLLELTTFLNHAKQPFYVEDGEVPIVTQKHLGQVFLNTEELKDSETKFTGKEWLKNYPSFKLKKGDLLYYSVGAYIGKTNVILNDLEATAASFLTIIRAKNEIDPVYLTVVLNSVIGQLQSEKWQSATAQQYIYPKDIKNFKIPILPKSTQQKIAELVRKSHEARKKSKELLEEAKRKVETSIETQSKRNDRKRRQIKRGQPVIYK